MNQTTQDLLNNYKRTIRDLANAAASISRVEETKAAAASQRHHEVLDDCIQEEQALLLKLRGLEQHRTKDQKALGWDGLTLKQILEKADSDQKEALAPLFQELEQQLKRLKEARNNSERIIGVRLHELDIIAARQQGASYNNEGNVRPAATSHARIHNKYV